METLNKALSHTTSLAACLRTDVIPGFVSVSLQEYGDIEYCVIIKNKSTGESKGLGYVRYYKPSQAAIAIENCDKSNFKSLHGSITGGGSGRGKKRGLVLMPRIS